MLQEHGGRERIDVAFATAGRAAHLANGAEGCGGGEPLVHETRGQAGAFLELGRDVSCVDGARRVVAVFVEGQADDEALDLELLAAPDHLRDWRALSGAAEYEASGRGDGAGRVADGEADAAVSVVVGEETN